MRTALRHALTPAPLSAALLSAALLLGAAPATAGSRQDATVIMPEDPKARQMLEDWGFADAVVSGDTVYLSGVVAGLREGETDLQPAFTRAFDRIGAILGRAGASWDDVVEMTTYHTDLTSQMPGFMAVKHRYVKQPFPAWTAIGVSRLVPGNGLVEMKVTAKLPAKAKP